MFDELSTCMKASYIDTLISLNDVYTLVDIVRLIDDRIKYFFEPLFGKIVF